MIISKRFLFVVARNLNLLKTRLKGHLKGIAIGFSIRQLKRPNADLLMWIALS